MGEDYTSDTSADLEFGESDSSWGSWEFPRPPQRILRHYREREQKAKQAKKRPKRKQSNKPIGGIAMTKKKQSALDLIKASEPLKTGSKAWHEKCESQAIADDLNAIRQAWQAGEFGTRTRNDIANKVKSHLKIKVTPAIIGSFLNGEKEAKCG